MPNALDPAAHEAIARHGRPALAWEILRRDPAYRSAYHRLAQLPPMDATPDKAFVTRWGVHFP
jgi:hypothetical protein